jgi:hypothetical protein
VAESCEHYYEPSGFIKGGEFFVQVSDYQFLKKDSGAWISYITNYFRFLLCIMLNISLFNAS